MADAPSPLAGGNGHSVPDLRRALVTELRRGGPASPDRLAARLGMSRTGVAQQLHALEAEGLVTRQAVRHGVGRPRHVYDVSPAAQGLLPSAYDGLAAGLLEAMAEIGGEELVGQVFETRRRRLAERLRASLEERVGADAPLRERVRELAVIQDEAGYLCRAETDGELLSLQEHNCAIFHVAAGSTFACEAETALFAEVLGAEVVRESRIAGGDRCCTFRVTERGDA